ncbi:MAG: OmpA family protein [Bacteroidetes bacterium]|nr:OmpA family protein [Bacteroidota bacterium]
MKSGIAFFSLTLLFIVQASLSLSQTREVKLMENGEYEKALTILRKKLEKDPADVPSHFYVARLLCDTAYHGYNLEEAYNSAKRASFYYMLSDESVKERLLKQQISGDTIIAETHKIIRAAFKNAKMGNTIESIENFLEKFRDSTAARTEAIEIRHALYFAIAEKQNDRIAYQQFMTNFPDARQYALAKEKLDRLVFTDFIDKNDIMSYARFAKTHKDNLFREEALEKFWNEISKENRFEDLDYFAKNFPRSKYSEEAFRRLFDKYNIDGELSSLQAFTKNYPDFVPDKPWYIESLKLANLAWQLDLTDIQMSTGLRVIESGNSWVIGDNIQDEDELKRRLERENAKTGELQFSLMWNNYQDLDLVCIDPGGFEFGFNKKLSPTGGVLDVDMNWLYGGHSRQNSEQGEAIGMPKCSDKPVENIYWPEGKAPEGHYRIFVRYFHNYAMEEKLKKRYDLKNEDPVSYIVRVNINGKYRDFYGQISYTEEKPRNMVFEFDYYSIPEGKGRHFGGISENDLKQYVIKAAPRELAYVALQRIIADDLREGRWGSAADTILKFRSYFSGSPAITNKIDKLIQLMNADEAEIKPENLGNNVNTEGNEYYPVISSDESKLYFCGRDRKDNMGGEDIFLSESIGRDAYGTSSSGWSDAGLFRFLNTAETNEAPLSVSVDGNTLLTFYGGNIFISEKTAEGWTSLEKLPYPVNTEYWEGDAMLTSDGRSIIFASNRPGGKNLHVNQGYYHGDYTYASDIYISSRTENGWSEPVNLGNSINTQYCERSPYLHPDMQTLFFSSDGRAGFGKLDVFIAVRKSDTSWTDWEEPVNLGKSINTINQDWGYKITTSGVYAYYSALNEQNNEDIYRIKLPDRMRPKTVVSVSGIVVDTRGRPLEATIHWEDLSENINLGTSGTDPENGNFFIILPAKKLYGYYAEAANFFPVSNNIDLTNVRCFKEIIDTIVLISMDTIKQMKAIGIRNLFFDTDSDNLRPESYPELNRLTGVLKEIISRDAETLLEIAGHTDDIGEEEYNQSLSEGRANAVRKFLIGQGINEKHITSVGYGEKHPVAGNVTEEGRSNNRRVEMRFIR